MTENFPLPEEADAANQNPPAERAIFYFDGFNFYHGLVEHSKARSYRWLNLRSLALSLLAPGHSLERVVFFTSVPPWDAGKARRHRTYLDALATVDVEVIEGRFQKESKECYASCRQFFDVYAEKLTDVQIATTIIRDGVQGRFDWAYLVTADADQVPTIRILREMVPSARVHLILPPRRNGAQLMQFADAHTGPLGHRSIKPHVFPDEIRLESGRIIQKPSTW